MLVGNGIGLVYGCESGTRDMEQDVHRRYLGKNMFEAVKLRKFAIKRLFNSVDCF